MIAHCIKKTTSGRSGERGQAFVELVLVLPLLLAIVFAVIEIGTVAADQVALQHAASDGARAGSTWGCIADTTCETNNAKAAASNASSDLNRCAVKTPTATVQNAAAADGSTPQWITVTVSCTYTAITPLGSFLSMLGGTFNLNLTRSATSKMRVAQ